MTQLAPYWKALIGFAAPAAVVLTSAVLDSSARGETITQGEWVTAVCAAVITGAAVYGKSNA